MKPLQLIFPLLFLICIPLLTLSGCGVKPENVEPPASVEHDTFPNTYPDAATDQVQQTTISEQQQ